MVCHSSAKHTHANCLYGSEAHLVQDIRIGDDDAKVNIKRGHNAALELEFAKLDRLHGNQHRRYFDYLIAVCIAVPVSLFCWEA